MKIPAHPLCGDPKTVVHSADLRPHQPIVRLPDHFQARRWPSRPALFELPIYLSLLLPAQLALAQTPEVAPAAPSEQVEKPAVQQVTISGRGNETDQRRQASAAKLIFGREELDRNGDSSLGEVLKRLPGVSIGGRPGRGGEPRMRGMAGGFTQILINGERAPRGFSIESLSPDQVERIEIIRGTVAEHSTQAIAGTINIILREGHQQRDIQLKITDSFANGRHQPNLSLTMPGKLQNWNYTLTGNLNRNDSQDHQLSIRRDLDSQAQLLLQEDQVRDSRRISHGFNFSPRLTWRSEAGDNLVLQSFILQNRAKEDGHISLQRPSGPQTANFSSANWHTDSRFRMARLFGTWNTRLDSGMRVELKFGANQMRADNATPRTEYDASGAVQTRRFDSTGTRERGENVSGKISKSVGDGHLLASGWEFESSRREQTRIALINGRPDPFNQGSDDALQANSRRIAAFVQDEWEINKQWSANLGVRWEGIRVRSGSIENSSSVTSPVLHGVWRIPGKERDQVRASVTHSYRAPQLANLIATPSLSSNNSATSTDRFGNPNLKPEQALGLELAYEHYLSEGGLLSANLFRRNIRDLMRREVMQEEGPLGARWVARPLNIGRATTQGLELEAKFRLSQWHASLPAIDIRANYSRYWSAVDGIPGPNNRIDGQGKHSANLGLDYRIPNSGLSLGGSLNWAPSYTNQTSLQQTVFNDRKRQLDVYGLWKINNNAQLHFGANNLLARHSRSANSLQERQILHLDEAYTNTDTTWSLRLELKL